MNIVSLIQALVVVDIIESVGIAVYKSCIFILSTLLMVLCLLGFNIYHIKMWRDPNSGASLLNKIYTRTALLAQVRVLSPKVKYSRTSNTKYISLFNLNTTKRCTFFKKKNDL